jgi:hypothetical protein
MSENTRNLTNGPGPPSSRAKKPISVFAMQGLAMDIVVVQAQSIDVA